ncbi:MAG: SEC-C metal-binding domain-containing protein [Pseudomonadota bacterium]
MSHRVFRLSISPDDAPEVRRVIDFDGRNTLHDVHELMQKTLSVGDDDHLYAFFLSGKYWDQSSEYVDPRTDGARADRVPLFRLKLRAGQRFVYVYDYGEEHRYSLSVVSVTETEAPLPNPVVIESVGDARRSPEDFDFDENDDEDEGGGDEGGDDEGGGDEGGDDENETDPALEGPFKLAAAVVEQIEALDDLGEGASSEETRPLLRKLGEATLAFVLGLDGNRQLLGAVDREFDLAGDLLTIPARLSAAGEVDLAVRIAEALYFVEPDYMNGEIALVHARAGDRERALALVLTNLETATEPYIAEYKAGDVYRELGEADAAEAYYRRALAIAETATARSEATLRIASLMIDNGREADAAAFVTQQRKPARSAAAKLPSAGRNDPCPCGSGKKYKKCHGA